MIYKPHGKQAAILDAAWEHVQSVPYSVSARWLFYRLLQDGLYTKKGDYKSQFLPLLSKARKGFYQGWEPDTLADESRAAIVRAGGDEGVAAWLRAVVRDGVKCELDHFFQQFVYVLIMYEARAMTRQFAFYTRRVDLYPFAGDPSIPYKWDIAKHIEGAAYRYGLPVAVLYFGDYDPKGESIGKAAMADIVQWSDAPFEWIRCGLNEGDGERFGIPENPEKPGQYQWEALDDATAGRLIRDSVGRYIDSDVIDAIERQEQEAGSRLRAHLARLEL